MLQETLDTYRRGAKSGVMKSATPNVVLELIGEIDRLQALYETRGERIEELAGICEELEKEIEWLKEAANEKERGGE